jgi:hypothetical protein
MNWWRFARGDRTKSSFFASLVTRLVAAPYEPIFFRFERSPQVFYCAIQYGCVRSRSRTKEQRTIVYNNCDDLALREAEEDPEKHMGSRIRST